MRIDYYHNKKNNITYVYQAESYYDPAKKRCGTRRTLIGKLDPQTGEVIPTGKRGRPRKEQDMGVESAAIPAEDAVDTPDVFLEEAEQEAQSKQGEDLAALQAELTRLKLENLELRRTIDTIVKAVSGYGAP